MLRLHMAGLSLALLLAGAAGAYEMAQHHWQDRLLVLVAPSEDDPGLQRQRQRVSDRSDAIMDRDLRVIELVGDSGKRDGEPLKRSEIIALRTQFAVADDARLMILVGLDGGERRRAPLNTDLRDLFLQIDAMPTRRADISSKQAAGIEVTDP